MLLRNDFLHSESKKDRLSDLQNGNRQEKMKQETKQKGNIPVQAEEVMSLFGNLFTRAIVRDLLQQAAPQQRLYWRILTPLLLVWGFVYQRLNREHTCDAYVSHLHSGAADVLDAADPHEQPLSQRLTSESTSAYAQGRKRLPLGLLQQAQHLVARHAQSVAGEKGRWHDLAVHLLDGTTFLLPPEGDLAATYGQASNKHGLSHWVKVRAVLACDWFSQVVVAMAETSFYSSESELVPEVLAQDESEGTLYLGDRNFGIYRVAQAIVGSGHQALLRLKSDRALALLKRQGETTPLRSGESRLVQWLPSRHDQPFPDWPATAILGRLIYLRVQQPGFRPFDLYLFTTLLDETRYPTAELCQLYAQRWHVEIHFRHVKTALEMDYFQVKSAQMFRKELAAGLLTYNLICVLMTQAALKVNLQPHQLSFKKCLRRIHDFLTKGVPAWVHQQGQVADYLLERLARCKLPKQPNKVRHEPRRVRYKPRPYPALHGDRHSARQKRLAELTE
jgi:hypothetical protein